MTYANDLTKPQWQRKRLEIMERDSWRCTACKAEDKTLHVHHRRYIRGRKPWEYEGSDLVTLCDECHKLFHEVNDAYKAKSTADKQLILEKILGDGQTVIKRGPFSLFKNPRDPLGCIVFHIPSGFWHAFNLPLENAVGMLDENPNSKQELLSVILDGAIK